MDSSFEASSIARDGEVQLRYESAVVGTTKDFDCSDGSGPEQERRSGGDTVSHSGVASLNDDLALVETHARW